MSTGNENKETVVEEEVKVDSPVDENAADSSDEVSSQEDEELGEGGLNALKAERKENADLRKTVKALKSDYSALSDKNTELLDQLTELKSAREAAEKRALVSEAASRHKLPDELRRFVVGDTADEIEESAKILGKHLSSRNPLGHDFLPGDRDDSDVKIVAGRERANREFKKYL